VRFSLFYDKLREELSRGDDAAGRPIIPPETPLTLATGHYAALTGADADIRIGKAADPDKDQSYMLYRIPRRMLPHLRFPLGKHTKRQVIAMVREAGLLEQAVVRESQDVCFVEGAYADFLRAYEPDRIDPGPGEITDAAGTVLGRHRGYIEYTVGQRKGLGLGTGPWYVTKILADKNRVIVAREEEAKSVFFLVEDTVWHLPDPFAGARHLA